MTRTKEEILALDYRDFGKLVDAYIKGEKSATWLEESERKLLESPEILPRLRGHMEGLQETLRSQIAKAQSELKVQQAEAELEGDDDKYLEATKEANRQIAVKERFGTGLSESLTQVRWLCSQAEQKENHKLHRIKEILYTVTDGPGENDFDTLWGALIEIEGVAYEYQ